MSVEKKLESLLYQKVRAMGGWAIKLWPVTVVGLPDRMVLLPGGRVSFVELKDTGKQPTPKQKAVMQTLLEMGFHVRVVDSFGALDNYIKALR